MEPRLESTGTPQTPIINVDIHIGPGRSGKLRTVTYDPPPGDKGYQFPRDSKTGQLHFHVVTPGYRIAGFKYQSQRGGTPGMAPEPGLLPTPKRSLRIDFLFDRIQDGHLRLQFENATVQFSNDPQVGNDGDTRAEARQDREVA